MGANRLIRPGAARPAIRRIGQAPRARLRGRFASTYGRVLLPPGVVGAIIGEISEISTSIASWVEEQGAATQEISRNVQEAAKGTQEVNTNISGVTQAASETGVAAKQMLDASGELSKLSESLGEDVKKFLAEIKAA